MLASGTSTGRDNFVAGRCRSGSYRSMQPSRPQRRTGPRDSHGLTGPGPGERGRSVGRLGPLGCPTRPRQRRTRIWRACRFYLLGTLLLAVVIVPFLPGLRMHALDAAGAFSGTPISGVQTFVEKLRGNLVWLGGTAMGLVIAVVGIMFMAGHSRAHDLAIRTIAGLAILASISGIVA
jgi:hypothetical protein